MCLNNDLFHLTTDRADDFLDEAAFGDFFPFVPSDMSPDTTILSAEDCDELLAGLDQSPSTQQSAACTMTVQPSTTQQSAACTMMDQPLTTQKPPGGTMMEEVFLLYLKVPIYAVPLLLSSKLDLFLEHVPIDVYNLLSTA